VEGLARLREFLSSGTAPLVFTQESTAVHNPRDFYEVSAEIAKRLSLRAVLVGTETWDAEPNRVLALPYISYSHVFPHASVIVHQGGSGTTGDALRAGRPMLVVPYGWDQPDNAYRIERLGVGLHVPRTRYTVETAAAAIQLLLDDPRFSMRSAEQGSRISGENAIGLACDAIKSLLHRHGHSGKPRPTHDGLRKNPS
jgi:UDP:flavonoid glycosyltransferase YjiC (YdhE family)